jgi:hypothetical protein
MWKDEALEEVRTQNFQFTNLERYRYTSLLGFIAVGNKRNVVWVLAGIMTPNIINAFCCSMQL